MDYDTVLAQVLALLQQEKRVAYRVLKRRLQLDDELLADLKDDVIFAKQVAVDEDGRVLVWTGDTAASLPTSPPTPDPARTPLTYTPSYLAEKILTSRSALEGERKQVTVLFADVKGSMELLADRDPEEARQLLDPVLERLMAAVHRYEGTVNQIMGDGIMALFGAPLAHEDHAVRACYAALAMQEAMRHYSAEVHRTHGVEVQIRVGLNSGEVVVRAIGNDLHMDYSAIGETTHLAARMEQLALPGTIRLTAATLRLVEGLIQVTALGPVPVKGLTAPVEVFDVVGASALRRRLQAAAARGLTPFVGRQTELDVLQRALAQAVAGQGQVVALVGEAGVGKSRLVYESIHSHRTQGWRALESASVSYGKATPYFPVIELLKRYAHVEPHDDTRTVRAKVTGQVLTLDTALQDTIPALLSLLDALPEDNPLRTLDPPQRRQRTLDGLKRVLLRETQEQPLLLVCEDLHWIDTETQALLDSLVESLPTARLLLLVNYRPEYQHGWGNKTFYTQLRLDPLPPASAEALLQTLLGEDASLAPLTQRLIARTEGNPFFLEESVRTLVETGELVGARGAYRLVQPVSGLQVPMTVQAILAARIDRLPAEDKRLLQTAAVVGTEVSLALLQAIAGVTEEGLHHGLARLQAAEFLYEVSLFPERAYTFKHALTHEVAYGSLLQERRRGLHARLVETLEALSPDRLAEQVDRLAHHAVRGQVWDKALRYCRQAGTRVAAQSAYREAVTYYEQALRVLRHLPDSRDRREQAIDVRLDLRTALIVLSDFGRLLDHLREAETLAEALHDRRRLGWVSAHLAVLFSQMGDQEQALASGQRALALAEALGDVVLQVRAMLQLGRIYYTLGDYRQAMEYPRRGMTYLEGDMLRERFGLVFLPSVNARVVLVECLAEVGAFAEGLAIGTEGLQIAEAVDHPVSRVIAYFSLGLLALNQGDFPEAVRMLERSLRLAQVTEFLLWSPRIASALGSAYACSGRVAEALPLLEQALEEAEGSGFLYEQALRVTWLSEAYLLAGRREEASEGTARALALARAQQERGHEAWALRLLGEIAARREPPEVELSEQHYRQALALAEELGMRPLQAHCQRGLGMLYARTGQRQQARALLAAAIALYRDMDMTFWLPEAETALAHVECEYGL
jgi:class 3 adenylate cyclase/tetratricopeptide (TPR) repeat protein